MDLTLQFPLSENSWNIVLSPASCNVSLLLDKFYYDREAINILDYAVVIVIQIC